jgi:hypothetical protein
MFISLRGDSLTSIEKSRVLGAQEHNINAKKKKRVHYLSQKINCLGTQQFKKKKFHYHTGRL